MWSLVQLHYVLLIYLGIVLSRVSHYAAAALTWSWNLLRNLIYHVLSDKCVELNPSSQLHNIV